MNVAMNKSEVYERWDDGFVIRRMTRDDAQQVLKWVGSNRTVCHELGVLQDISGDSVDGFYAGELNGELVSSVVITPIADDMQYVGYLHIVERLRGSGFARRLMTTARDVERRRNWSGMVCLNTVPDAEPLFEKFCYKLSAS